jgi:hypothetical protein
MSSRGITEINSTDTKKEHLNRQVFLQKFVDAKLKVVKNKDQKDSLTHRLTTFLQRQLDCSKFLHLRIEGLHDVSSHQVKMYQDRILYYIEGKTIIILGVNYGFYFDIIGVLGDIRKNLDDNLDKIQFTENVTENQKQAIVYKDFHGSTDDKIYNIDHVFLNTDGLHVGRQPDKNTSLLSFTHIPSYKFQPIENYNNKSFEFMKTPMKYQDIINFVLKVISSNLFYKSPEDTTNVLEAIKQKVGALKTARTQLESDKKLLDQKVLNLEAKIQSLAAESKNQVAKEMYAKLEKKLEAVSEENQNLQAAIVTQTDKYNVDINSLSSSLQELLIELG